MMHLFYNYTYRYGVSIVTSYTVFFNVFNNTVIFHNFNDGSHMNTIEAQF